MGTSWESDLAVSDLAPTVPQRHENEGFAGAGRRGWICATVTISGRTRPDWTTGSAAAAVLAATGDGLWEETGSAAAAEGEPHGAHWGWAKTALANRSMNSMFFITGLPEEMLSGSIQLWNAAGAGGNGRRSRLHRTSVKLIH